MATRRGSYQARGSRRQTSWDEGPGGTGITQLSSVGSVFLGSVAQALVDGLTIVRLRGSFAAYLETAAAVGQGYQGAIGLGVVSENAFGVGITAVPTPITDSTWDGWLYHRFFGVHRSLAATGAGEGSSQIRFEVDSKAMRKIPESDALIAVVEMVEIGTATIDMFFDSRILVKLA